MQMKELTFSFYFFDTGFSGGNGLLPSVPDPPASSFFFAGVSGV